MKVTRIRNGQKEVLYGAYVNVFPVKPLGARMKTREIRLWAPAEWENRNELFLSFENKVRKRWRNAHVAEWWRY